MKLRFAGFVLAIAAAVATAKATGDLEQGRTKSLACQACHGSAGIGTAADIPNLAGQKPGYITAQLGAFRARERKHDLMNAIAAQLSDADIANLAAFWSSLPAGGSSTADLAAEIRKSRMTFPVTFPKDFVMYAEEVDAESKSMKRSYANHAIVNAARAGMPLPEGSTIIVENSSAKPGEKAGTWFQDQVTSYAAMGSNAGWGEGIPEILRNGDWSYALFDEKKTLRADFNYARCLACHKPKADSSYVFGLTAIVAEK
jgi:cytochrome c553